MTKLEHITTLRENRVPYEEIATLYSITKQAVQNYCKYHKIFKGQKQPKKLYKEKRKSFIENNIEINSKTQCWEWKKSLSNTGYGRMSFNGNATYAHRVSYHLYVDESFSPFQQGRNTDTSLHVLHKCDNPKCCNPEHLWLGTPMDNMKDRDLKGRGK